MNKQQEDLIAAMVFTIEEILEKSRREANGVSFEDALKRTRFGKFHYFLIIISGIFMASAFFETMGVNYALPVAECDLNITTKQEYGIVSGIWFAGIILTSHLWGFLSDTYGRRKILIVASLSAFGGSVLSSLAVNLWQMALFRLINGLWFGHKWTLSRNEVVTFAHSISGSTSAIFAYLGEFLGTKNRSRSMMASSFVFGVFCLVLPFMAWLLINQSWSFVIPLISVTYKPWRLFLMACGLPSLVCGLTLIFFPESPKFTFSQGDEVGTLEIFKQIYYINTGNRDYDVYRIKPNEEFAEAQKNKNIARMMWDQTVSLIRDYPRSIGLISTIQFGIYFVCNGMLLFFPDILNQTASFLDKSSGDNVELCFIVEDAIEKKLATVANSTMDCVETLDISAYSYAIILEACYTVGFFLVSLLVNYVGRLSIFSVVFFSTGISGFLITVIPNPTVSTYLYVWLLVSGVNNTLLNTVTYDLFPTNLRSLAMGLSLMMGRLGSLVGGNIAGYMLEGHCNAMFNISGVVLVICGALTFMIPNVMSRK